MKNYLNSKKLVKSFIVTTVLSFGLFSGGHFTAAAGLDKAKAEPVKAIQVNSSQNIHTSKKATPAEPVNPVVPAKTAAPVKPEVPVNSVVPAKSEIPVKSVIPAKTIISANPKAEGKAENSQKSESKMVKSQASVHASETAREHANQNSAIFSNEPLAELNQTDAITEYAFGSDSASSLPNTQGEDFYLGKLGYGDTVQFDPSTGSGIYFSSARAQNASYVYGYWFLSGMQTAPLGTSPSEWGVQQAKLALATYETMKRVYGSKVRPVIFIDVESALTGMNDYDYANNQTIYTAFVNYLNQYGQGVKPGTYSSPWNWELTMGTFSPNTPGAYWVACYPGDIPSDLTTSNPDWLNFPGTNEKAEIWQYYGGSNDYDVAWKLP
ncbi:hypothetical protein [Neobacillus cucumis]|uniref:Uncharacterized protein n=1 Tax=Neobacillus cucumis TaxID=1740721 RepID=A0A2N5HFK6_9BACI|nr:hypothetical protein [Neobacillus cucumis]PLS04287.1 hypothetical protein CVD27_12360 [Neobacillus cucumis]